MQKGILALAAALFMILPFQNCAPQGTAQSGTETGNAMGPGTGPGTGPSVGDIPAQVSVVDQACAALATCHPGLNLGSCQSRLNTLQGLPQALGVPTSVGVSTANEIAGAEQHGTIHLSTTNEAACATVLHSLPCSDAAVSAAYDSGQDSYAGLLGLLAAIPACHAIY